MMSENKTFKNVAKTRLQNCQIFSRILQDILTGKKINWSTAVLENNSESSYSLLKKVTKMEFMGKISDLIQILARVGHI